MPHPDLPIGAMSDEHADRAARGIAADWSGEDAPRTTAYASGAAPSPELLAEVLGILHDVQASRTDVGDDLVDLAALDATIQSLMDLAAHVGERLGAHPCAECGEPTLHGARCSTCEHGSAPASAVAASTPTPDDDRARHEGFVAWTREPVAGAGDRELLAAAYAYAMRLDAHAHTAAEGAEVLAHAVARYLGDVA